MSKLVSIIYGQGPLPLSATAKVISDGSIVLVVSGSVWTNTAGSLIGVQVLMDGAPVGTATIFANPSTTHMALISVMIPITTTIDSHTFELVALNSNTVSDLNDTFYLSILY